MYVTKGSNYGIEEGHKQNPPRSSVERPERKYYQPKIKYYKKEGIYCNAKHNRERNF